MTDQSRDLLLQPLGMGKHSLLGAHFGTTAYLLEPEPPTASPECEHRYESNETFWQDVIRQRAVASAQIILQRFCILDWFPRAPGLYHTSSASFARQEAHHYLHRGFHESPVRDHARHSGKARPNDYTVVFTPEGKLSMLEGGIGSIRLKPIDLGGIPHWLMTATSDGVAHAGVPIAVPRPLYSRMLSSVAGNGFAWASLRGELDFVPDCFAPLFDHALMVPRIYVRVTDIVACEPPASIAPEVSAAVSFISDYKGWPDVYASYVTFRPDVEQSFPEAVGWMKEAYVEGEYHGRIITDFDQTRTIFPEARFALSRVMGRLISEGTLRETIELMNITADVGGYLSEIDRQNLLPRKSKGSRKGVFISYAHAAEKDTGWVRRLRTHLQGLALSSGVDVWDDTRIDPGQRWRREIERALARTRVAILILTPEFTASKFIQETELPTLLQVADADGATILCVYGKHLHLTGSAKKLQQYQFVNEPERPLHGLSKSSCELVFKEIAILVEKALNT